MSADGGRTIVAGDGHEGDNEGSGIDKARLC